MYSTVQCTWQCQFLLHTQHSCLFVPYVKLLGTFDFLHKIFFNFSIRCLCTWYSTVCIDFITFLQFQYPMSMYMIQYVLISLLFYNFSIRCKCTVMHWFHYFFYIKNFNFSTPCPCFVGVDLITLMCALCVLCLQLCAIHYACAYVTLLCTFQ